MAWGRGSRFWVPGSGLGRLPPPPAGVSCGDGSMDALYAFHSYLSSLRQSHHTVTLQIGDKLPAGSISGPTPAPEQTSLNHRQAGSVAAPVNHRPSMASKARRQQTDDFAENDGGIRRWL